MHQRIRLENEGSVNKMEKKSEKYLDSTVKITKKDF